MDTRTADNVTPSIRDVAPIGRDQDPLKNVRGDYKLFLRSNLIGAYDLAPVTVGYSNYAGDLDFYRIPAGFGQTSVGGTYQIVYIATANDDSGRGNIQFSIGTGPREGRTTLTGVSGLTGGPPPGLLNINLSYGDAFPSFTDPLYNRRAAINNDYTDNISVSAFAFTRRSDFLENYIVMEGFPGTGSVDGGKYAIAATPEEAYNAYRTMESTPNLTPVGAELGSAASRIVGSAVSDALFGTAIGDSISGNGGNDTAIGGDGADTINGDAGADLLFGNVGADLLNGSIDNDILYGGRDDDTLYGEAGNDIILGDLGNDSIVGGDDGDALSGGDGGDRLFGNAGADLLFGNKGNDVLYGGGDADTLHGGSDNDWLSGDQGNDYLFGDAGADTLIGGAGDDLLIGGGGQDLFAFVPGPGRDVIIDFNAAENDRIGLRGAGYRINGDAPEGAIVEISNGGIIILNGIQSSTIQSNWFVAI